MPNIEFKAMIANVAGERRAPGLGAHVREHSPHLVVLSEAYRIKNFCSRPIFSAYKLNHFFYPRMDCPVTVLVREDCRWPISKPVFMNEKWRGPTGRLRNPRLYERGRIKVKGTPIRYMGVHFEPFGPTGRNSKAWNESHKRTEAFLNKTPNTFSLALGDFNVSDIYLSRHRSNARHYVTSLGKVDHFIANKHPGKNAYYEVKRLELPRNHQRVGYHGWFLGTFLIPAGA